MIVFTSYDSDPHITSFAGFVPRQVRKDVERIVRAKGEVASNRLDRMMSGALNGVTSDVNNALFPNGLLKPFPGNCFSLMTTSGAKGGLVIS